MNRIITLPTLVELISKSASVDPRFAEKFVMGFTTLVGEALSTDESVRIKGFGTFRKKHVADKTKIEFNLEKEIADYINAPFASFEPEILADSLTADILDAKVNETVRTEPTEVTEAPLPVQPESVPDVETPQPEVETVVTETVQEILPEIPDIESIAAPVIAPVTPDIVEAKSEESAPAEPHPEEILPEEILPEETIPAETEPQMPLPEPSLPEEILPEEVAKPAEPAPVEALPEEPMPTEPMPTESQPIETQPEETKPVATERPQTEDTPQEKEEPKTLNDRYKAQGSPYQEFEEEMDYATSHRHVSWFWIAITFMGALILGGCIGFFCHDIITGDNGQKNNEVLEQDLIYNDFGFDPDTTESPVEEDTTDIDLSEAHEGLLTEDSTPATPEVTASQESAPTPTPKVEETKYDTVTSKRYLTTMAREYYGDKVYWVYIYLDNTDILRNPNEVKAGTKVRIPPREKYDVSSDPAENLANATEMQRKIFNKYNIH